MISCDATQPRDEIPPVQWRDGLRPMPLPAFLAELPEKLLIVFGARLSRLILFGSRAEDPLRAEANGSDWDLAVIVHDARQPEDLGRLVAVALEFGGPWRVDLKLWGERELDQPFWIFHDIRTKGRLLWERPE